jgi:hypothetical protein
MGFCNLCKSMNLEPKLLNVECGSSGFTVADSVAAADHKAKASGFENKSVHARTHRFSVQS